MTSRSNIFFKIYLFFFLLTYVLIPEKLRAYDFIEDSGLNTTAQGTGHLGIPLFNTDSPLGIIGVIIGVILSFLGVIFLLLIIYGGFLWMTAAGNEEKVTKAKKIIQNSIVGLIIVIAAYAITVFVGTQLT